MGALGNGRRGGRAPPLMVAALIVCIFLLSFNYWVSSSRNLELQGHLNYTRLIQTTVEEFISTGSNHSQAEKRLTKLYELEQQVQHGAAERGVIVVKNKEFQEQVNQHKQQISRIESLHRKELDDAQSTHSQEKAKLQQNISFSTKTIEELKGQLNLLNDDLGKLQKQLQSCQAITSTLNKTFTVDMVHCQSQLLSQKKLCDEKIAAVKLEVENNMQKVIQRPGDPAKQKNAEVETVKEDPTERALSSEADTTVLSQNPNVPQAKGNEAPQLLTNISIAKESSEQPPTDELSKIKPQTVPSTVSGNKKKLQLKAEEGKMEKTEATTEKDLTNSLIGDKDVEVMDTHDEEADPGMEDMLIGQGKADDPAINQKLEEPDEYDGDEQIVGGVDLEKEQRNKNMEEEMADYNGDDDNEGEFEADKQAALAQF